MIRNIIQKTLLLVGILAILFSPTLSLAKSKKAADDKDKIIQTMVAPSLFEKAQANNNWKTAFITGKHEQVVFMNISPETNPNNEIGMETHPFDQIIMIAQGNGKAVLNGRDYMVKTGDLIFIGQGTPHNVINLNSQSPLKIVSIYSSTDIPANAIYKTKADESKK